MNIIESLQYKYKLNKYIEGCLKQGYTYASLWEYLSTDPSFLDFTTTRIGIIWKKKLHGVEFVKWVTS